MFSEILLSYARRLKDRWGDNAYQEEEGMMEEGMLVVAICMTDGSLSAVLRYLWTDPLLFRLLPPQLNTWWYFVVVVVFVSSCFFSVACIIPNMKHEMNWKAAEWMYHQPKVLCCATGLARNLLSRMYRFCCASWDLVKASRQEAGSMQQIPIEQISIKQISIKQVSKKQVLKVGFQSIGTGWKRYR